MPVPARIIGLFRLRALRPQAVATFAVAGVLVAAVAVSSLGHGGHSDSSLTLTSGQVWFPDPATGQVSLLDGLTLSRVVTQPVANRGDQLSVVPSGSQSGSSAIVLDQTTGQVTSVNGALLDTGAQARLTSPGDQRLALVSDAKATWAIEQSGSLADQLDPTTLQPLGPPAPLSSAGADPIETPNGDMWATGSGGQVYSFANGSVHSRTNPDGGGRFNLVEAGSRPVLADAGNGRLITLDPTSGQVAGHLPFTPPGTGPLVTGGGASPVVLAVSPSAGALQVTDLRTGRASTVVIGDSTTNPGRYGPAITNGSLVFVPDFQNQDIVIASLGSDGQLSLLGQVPVGDRHFDLVNTDNSIWFDDPQTDVAGVVTPKLDSVLIPKSGGTGAGRLLGHLAPVHFATAHPTPQTIPSTSHTTGTTPASTSTTASPTTTIAVPAATTTTAPATTTTTAPATTTTTLAPLVPSFDYSPKPPDTGQGVTFVDTTPGPHKVSQWTFAGGSPSTSGSASPTVTWSAANTYTVTLTVEDANGQNAVATSQQVTVNSATVCGAGESSGASVGTAGGQGSWTVPTGVTSATFTLMGAGGGASIADDQTQNPVTTKGGSGAEIVLTVPVTPCAVWTVDPGGVGQVFDATKAQTAGGAGGTSAAGYTGAAGGSPAGIADLIQGAGGAGGGAATVVTGQSQTIIAAGGGGAGGMGAGNPTSSPAVANPPGNAGGNSNTAAASTQSFPTASDGANGQDGASTTKAGTVGQDGQDDWGSNDSSGSGGGGGGGLKGGAGGGDGTCAPQGDNSLCGAGGGGGGGTDKSPSGAKVTNGKNAGNGSVTITWTVTGGQAGQARTVTVTGAGAGPASPADAALGAARAEGPASLAAAAAATSARLGSARGPVSASAAAVAAPTGAIGLAVLVPLSRRRRRAAEV
ncbi:MAG TPA: PKD domain-containing protein [Acidimicrobiales bacterium]|jgi:hypothetical protein|nr:PKD domain-containing protein [Acidimicrobiales bacterium]